MLSTDDDATPARIRETYDEYTVGDTTVVMISDPLNEHAWVQTTGAVTVDP